MDLATARLLASPEAAALLAGLDRYRPETALAQAESLRGAGHPPDLVAAVLTQARLAGGTQGRLAPWGHLLLLTEDGGQQATRPVVARHRARRFTASGIRSVADLGCGIGVDALALAEAGLTVRAVEQDPATAELAGANAERLGLANRVTVTVAAAQDVRLDDVAAVFADPSRRAGGRRIADPAAWSPPLGWVLTRPLPELAAKVAPGLADDAVPADVEREVVSHHGHVVEAALYRGALRSPGVRRRATLLPSGATLTDADLPTGGPRVGPLAGYLYEPDGAVIRAGLVAAVSDHVDGALVDPTLAYVTTAQAAETPFARRFQVEAVMPFQLKRLRAALRERDVGAVEIKTRGSAVDPEDLRRRLRLSGGQVLTVVVTRVKGEPVAILARRG
ncbi:MAG: class I SAM-dependent methyltransferase [Actinomycetota bacterium]|nr:class I SAM-dependent methyltransferase [Actinomycetota bacterium]